MLFNLRHFINFNLALLMLKPSLRTIVLLTAVITVFFSCKKSTPGINIPDTDHMQFSLGGSTHYLSNMRAFTDTVRNTPLKLTVIEAFNMADGVDESEMMTINIYRGQPLHTGDTFMAGTQYTNTGAQFNYIPVTGSGGPTGISFQGQPGSITLTDVTPTYIKGTFSVQLFNISDYYSNTAFPQPVYSITNGSFYATMQN